MILTIEKNIITYNVYKLVTVNSMLEIQNKSPVDNIFRSKLFFHSLLNWPVN